MSRHDVVISYANGAKDHHYGVSAERANELEAAALTDPHVQWCTVVPAAPRNERVIGIVNNYYTVAPGPAGTPIPERRAGIDDREYPLTPHRPNAEPIEGGFEGPWTMWQDGRQTYVLQWGDGAAGPDHGWQLADWLDTVIMAVEALRLDRHKLDKQFLRSALNDVRKLKSALAPIEDGLLLAARTTDPTTSDALLSWRELATAMDIHHSTISARHARLMAGERPDWWTWLTRNVAPLVGEESGR